MASCSSMNEWDETKQLENSEEVILKGLYISQRDTDLVGQQMSDVVVKHNYYLCLGGAINTPGDFYLNPYQSWNALEVMMVSIQKEYEKIETATEKNLAVPAKEDLIPGYVVGARCYKEFHRAKILSVLADDTYQVQLLDYGDILTLPFEEIRYLPYKFLKMMKFQAIKCTLRFRVSRSWSKEEGDFFRKLIFDRKMAIFFKTKFDLEDGDIWEVSVHFYEDKFRKRIKEFHVQRKVFQKFGRAPFRPGDEKCPDFDNYSVDIVEFKFVY